MTDFRKLKEELFKVLFFARSFFASAPELEVAAPTDTESTDLRIDRGLWRGSKYRDLLELLKRARDAETRWLILAWWLKQEGVCEPEELLPNGLLRRMANKFFQGVSFMDIRHARLVETWRPYFEPLMDDLRTTEAKIHRFKERLAAKGYDAEAIDFCVGRRKVIPVICNWLAGCGRLPKSVDASTLQNAYSRYSRAREKVIAAQNVTENQNRIL